MAEDARSYLLCQYIEQALVYFAERAMFVQAFDLHLALIAIEMREFQAARAFLRHLNDEDLAFAEFVSGDERLPSEVPAE